MRTTEQDRSADVTDLDFRILGPVVVTVNQSPVTIATRRQRALLVLLLLKVGRVVPAERLIDQLWDGAPPPQAHVTLRSYVSNLRQTLAATGLGAALVTRGSGYMMDVPAGTIDATRLRTLTERGRDLLRRGEPLEGYEALDEAVSLWAGDPLAEIADHEVAQSSIVELTQTYLGAAESRFEALLALGRHADALPGLEAFTADHPLREEPQALLMLALHRSGRAPEALELHRRFRASLQDELGIDPSPTMDALVQQILAQDPALSAPSTVAGHTRPDPSPPSSHDPESRPRHDRGTVDDVHLVGRRRELAILQDMLDRLTFASQGALVLIAGEPGIGKTTLLDSLARMARQRGIPVHSGRAPAASGAPAFWPWSQVLDGMAAALDEEQLRLTCTGPAKPAAQLSSVIAERTGLSVPATGDNLQSLRFTLYEAASVFIGRMADHGPTLILLDDMHWADLPSLELLSYLTPSLATRPLLVVAAYRDLPGDRTEALEATLATVAREDVAHEVRLSGLGADDVATLAADVLATTDEPAKRERLAAVLYQRTGGNPFFVRQLARLLLESTEGNDPAATSVPPGVRHVIASRLKPLPEDVLSMLAAAAVIGPDFDLRTCALAAGLEMEAALDAFDVAMRHGLVERAAPASTHRFVHALVQDVVLQELPAGRVARLHAAVAEHLERAGMTSPAVLAEHWWRAREIVGLRAVPPQVAAADAAASVFAHEQAEVHLRRALHLVRGATPPDPDSELGLLLSLFSLILTARGWGDPDVQQVVDRAMQLAEAGTLSDDTARLWWSLFFFLIDRDREREYVDLARSLLAACDVDTSVGNERVIGFTTRAAVHLMNIFSTLSTDDRAAAGQHLLMARTFVEKADMAALTSYDENLHVMLCLIEAYWSGLLGDTASQRSAIDAAVALADADGRPFPRAVARSLGAATGAYSTDLAYFGGLSADALELDHRFGFAWLATVAECIQDWSRTLTGHADTDTVAALERRLDEMLAAGRHGTHSTMLLLLGDVHAAQGRVDEARETFLRARARPGPYRGLVVDLIDRRLNALP
ncbi:BTAD domain-containing putative transcriptional regulator [Oryzobacter telluris]|uniref:BTAD domain-containing putative transcriptional regulator n=1 Tax=Oryzobacter telluris TaxID=3149179 RepID=UPI00370DBA0F